MTVDFLDCIRPDVSARELSDSSRIVALLDSAREFGGYGTVTLFSDQFAVGVAERTLRLWAETNNFALEERSPTEGNGRTHTLNVAVHPYRGVRISLHIKETA